MMRRLWICLTAMVLGVSLCPRSVAARPPSPPVPPTPYVDDELPSPLDPDWATPPQSPRDLKLVMLGFRLQVGGAIPTHVATGMSQTVGNSAFVRLEFTMDVSSWVQLGVGIAAGDNVNSHAYSFAATGGGTSPRFSSSGPAYGLLRAHVYPLPLRALGFFRPYVGLGIGYGSASASGTQTSCSNDFLFGRHCSDNTITLAAYSGASVEFTGGFRYDLRISRATVVQRRFRGAWLIPFYLEVNYLKNFWNKIVPSGLDGRFDLLSINGGIGMMF